LFFLKKRSLEINSKKENEGEGMKMKGKKTIFFLKMKGKKQNKINQK